MKRIFLISYLLAVTALLAGCSNDSVDFQAESYTVDAASIEEIHIDVRDRTIAVSPASSDQIQIDYFDSEKEFYDLSVSDDHVLTMTMKTQKGWTDYIGGKTPADSRKISLQIPDTLSPSLVLSTTNGDITLDAQSAGRLSLSSNGGNIVFDKLTVETALSLENKNGDIRGTVIGGYDDFSISCAVKKGESNLPAQKEDGAKTLHATNNNGDIEIKFVKE